MSTESLTLLTTTEASMFVRLATRTLEGLRVRGGGPVFRKLAGRVFYAESDLVAWVDSRARESTSDSGHSEDPEPEEP